MKWIKKIFRKTVGTFVSVDLDYGFGPMVEGVKDATKGPFAHTLHITDLSLKEASKALDGKRFDWHKIHSHWRHYLEINGFHSTTWSEAEKYLREWK